MDARMNHVQNLYGEIYVILKAYCILRNSVLCGIDGICIMRNFYGDICNLQNIFPCILRKIWMGKCKMRNFRIIQFKMRKFRIIQILVLLDSAKYRQVKNFSAIYSKVIKCWPWRVGVCCSGTFYKHEANSLSSEHIIRRLCPLEFFYVFSYTN